jgi:hypothetical protein
MLADQSGGGTDRAILLSDTISSPLRQRRFSSGCQVGQKYLVKQRSMCPPLVWRSLIAGRNGARHLDRPLAISIT